MPAVKQGIISSGRGTMGQGVLSAPAPVRSGFPFTSLLWSTPLLTAISSLSRPALVVLIIIAHYYRASLVWMEIEASFITVKLKPVVQTGQGAGSGINPNPAPSLLSPDYLSARHALYHKPNYS